MFNDETVQTRFTLALRGYDRDEVEAHLTSLQKRLDAAEAALVEAERLTSQRAADGSGPPTLDDIGHNIAEVLRAAQEQAERIREAAAGAADDVRAGAERDAAGVRSDAEGAAAEIRRAAAEEVAAIRVDAQARVDQQLEEACSEADRLTAAAAAEHEAAHQLRVKAEHDRELAVAAVVAARDQADRIIETAYADARRRVEELAVELTTVLAGQPGGHQGTEHAETEAASDDATP